MAKKDIPITLGPKQVRKLEKKAAKADARGFVRACILILGASTRWPRKDRALYNKATRKLFGKKRKG